MATTRTQHADVERLRAALIDMTAAQGATVEQLAAPPGYAHLPLAIIDSVYSLRSPYSAARAAVSAYCAHANIEDRGTAGGANRQLVEHTVADFLSEISDLDGDELATCFGGARYKAPGTNVLKAEVCVAAGDALRVADVNTRRDLDDDTRFASARGNWKAVRGLGQQSWSYFTMLVGVDDWKVDTWVNRFVNNAIGRAVNATEARGLLDAAKSTLETQLGASLSMRALDHAIWRSASGRPPR